MEMTGFVFFGSADIEHIGFGLRLRRASAPTSPCHCAVSRNVPPAPPSAVTLDIDDTVDVARDSTWNPSTSRSGRWPTPPKSLGRTATALSAPRAQSEGCPRFARPTTVL